MEASYKQYLEELYSSSPGAKFLGLWEAADPTLDAHKIVYGPGGFGNTRTIPNLMISDENPQEYMLSWMLSCLDMASIHEECYLWLRSGPWGHVKISERTNWLSSVWGMKYPQTNDTVVTLLLMTADYSQALYFAEQGRVLEVYIKRLK